MNRKSLFLIGFTAAAITFGTLMAIIGPRHFNAFRYHHHCESSRHITHDEQSLKPTEMERQFMNEEH